MSKASKSIPVPDSKKELKKSWIDWDIPFDNNASEQEKAQRLMAIIKYILEYLSLYSVQIASINFSTKNLKQKTPATNIKVDLKYLVPKAPPRDSPLGEQKVVPSQIPAPTKPA